MHAVAMSTFLSACGRVRVSHLSKTRNCRQVAAVCFRVRAASVEFLLVQTRGSGRWTFPKGSAEVGMTYAQVAALEALEEAGVHGTIEEAAFIRYIWGGSAQPRPSAVLHNDALVSAHLCEVRRLCKPKEDNRNRTWFSADDAKARLREGRNKVDGNEFARVVDRAVARIQRSRKGSQAPAERSRTPEFYLGRMHHGQLLPDALRKVQFEMPPHGNARVEPVVTATRFPVLGMRRFILDANSEKGSEMDQLPQPNRSLKLLAGTKKTKA